MINSSMLHKRNIYKVTTNSKKAHQVNPEPFKPAQVSWTYFFYVKTSQSARENGVHSQNYGNFIVVSLFRPCF